ncbi:hypothetical protein TNCT_91441 [Trichonephila clavata]|uniref:Uncharacterized protein n=1 Tax=Trichonephila clavata TaxID=2740835 RepID=A0A8X6LJN2_TRICU|nr:hypothetical protein TNCT_91441 [Trichonephila clavata]
MREGSELRKFTLAVRPQSSRISVPQSKGSRSLVEIQDHLLHRPAAAPHGFVIRASRSVQVPQLSVSLILIRGVRLKGADIILISDITNGSKEGEMVKLTIGSDREDLDRWRLRSWGSFRLSEKPRWDRVCAPGQDRDREKLRHVLDEYPKDLDDQKGPGSGVITEKMRIKKLSNQFNDARW